MVAQAANSLGRGQSSAEHILQAYHDIVRPHVDSFDDFIDTGMARVTQHIDPVRVRHPSRALRESRHVQALAVTHTANTQSHCSGTKCKALPLLAYLALMPAATHMQNMLSGRGKLDSLRGRVANRLPACRCI